jgi:four helix bundle protein
MNAKDYRGLIAWQKAMDFVEGVYGETRSFPREELYGLTSQLRRAAVSIPSNIAEGHGRGKPKEFTQFLTIAHGSLREVETQLMIAQRLKYSSSAKVRLLLDLAGEIGRLINGLINYLSK